MTKEQLEVIVALISSQQMALTHLSLKVASLTGCDKQELANSFLQEGERLLTRHNGKLANVIFSQIARGIEAGEEQSQENIRGEINGLLH
ncbi:TPA: hypothetical protein LAN07_004437 [Escherichia coli]|uniref:Uncharacterized protein n=4 Tax=Escherichia TaxID=561 RepID=A0A2S8JJ04_ECOLX|nr:MULTISPECIES: hypothetical protein [Escherichia]ELW2702611.1 hypothetical protein [Escherichia coli O26]AEJ56938.1 hypothetical protein UMNF18_2356 [Escherichia coli UMNF18]EEC8083832.1 hypothetical protein [Escherichia coli]EEC8160309.1 hypothetical protein [Escherichia coli]EED0148449.1 hypothetical protein [Escherichia coli]